MDSESWIEGEIDEARKRDLERRIIVYPNAGGKIEIGAKQYLNFSSNDYLDLAKHPNIVKASRDALDRYGAGATSSRLVTGTLGVHDTLEGCLASFKGYPSALLFGSGYMTNAGVITTLVGRDDVVFADRLAHASILDAITLSRAKLVRFQHNDVDHLRDQVSKSKGRRKLIVTESVFSMDGDLAPLQDIAEIATEYGAMLMVDEAHATGVFGPGGGGLVRQHKLEGAVNVSMGTLSKALGAYGGFVACSPRMRDLLINKSRALIYTTALPPPAAGAALGALELLGKHPGLPGVLVKNATTFRNLLARAGLNLMNSESQIVPVIIGDNKKALALSARLRERGILAVAIRPPTVPEGTARLRFSVTLAHSERELAKVANIVISEANEEGIG